MNEFTLQTPTQEPGLETAMQFVYKWNYDPEVDELRNLYVKAAEAQWVGARDLDWERPIDLVKFASTPLGAGIPIEKTSYWRSLPRETIVEITAGAPPSASRSSCTASRAPSWSPRSS
jgi:hypothetical protein